LLLTLHHVLADGWSGEVLLRDLHALYRCGADAGSLPAPAPFRDYLAWLQAQDKGAARAAWREYLHGFDTPTLVAGHAPAAQVSRQAQFETALPAALSARLEALARRHGLTLASVLQGAWGVLLARLLNRSEVCFGNVGSGRQAPVAGIEEMLG